MDHSTAVDEIQLQREVTALIEYINGANEEISDAIARKFIESIHKKFEKPELEEDEIARAANLYIRQKRK